VLKEFVEFARKNGVEEAGVEYGVSKKIDELLEIADYSQKNNATLDEMTQGGRISTKLKELELDPEATYTFVEKVCTEAQKKQFSGIKLLEGCLELERLSKKYNLDYDGLLQMYDDMGKQVRTTDEQFLAKKKEIEAYSRLRSTGVDDESILRWDRIVAQTNLTPDVIGAELTKIASLEHLSEQKSEKIRKLEIREKELKSTTSDLDSQKKVLLESIGLIAESTKESLTMAKDAALTEFQTALAGFKSKATKDFGKIKTETDGSTFTLGETIKQLQTTMNDFKTRLSEAARFEEELKIARLFKAITEYPEEAKAYPLDWALLLIETAIKLCTVKGVDTFIPEPPAPTLLNYLNTAAKCIIDEIGEKPK
jgi:hypothetical protein